ncbi:MAG: alkaline phosphatase family protein [Polyangiaceae bacterium]|nr:alkaline phosphatase family protein [Polyangiaceae bacterium]
MKKGVGLGLSASGRADQLSRRLLLKTGACLGVGGAISACQHRWGPGQEKWCGRGHEPVEEALIVLVAVDGVRWQDVFYEPRNAPLNPGIPRRQLIPQLMAMESNGIVLGAPGTQGFFASGPNFVSLPGYMEMLSGTSDLACTENDCQRMQRLTLLDGFQRKDPSDPTLVGAFSSWAQIEVAASSVKSGVVSTGRWGGFGHSALQGLPGCCRALAKGKADGGGWGDFRYDEITAELALSFLREVGPKFLFLSLGETDEYGHAGSYSEYLQSLTRADDHIGKLRHELAKFRRAGRSTLLLVTTDHGRAANFRDHGRQYPESARSFLFAEGTMIPPRGRVNSSQPRYLKDIVPTIREIFGLREQTAPQRGRILEELLV